MGELYTISAGPHVARIREVGAALLDYSVGDRPVVAGPAPAQPPGDLYRGGRGQVLMPWPNRVADGQYEIDGVQLQLPVNEVSKGHASHGFVRSLPWAVVDRSPSSLTLSVDTYAQPGYPFPLRLTLDYAVDDGGLRVRMSGSNRGDVPCPFGMGAHPFFTTGSASIDEDSLTMPASRSLQLDDRMIPTGETPTVEGTGHDFRKPTPLAGQVLDMPFTDFVRNADGVAEFVITRPDGASTAVWMDGSYAYAMVFTGDTLGNPDDRRRAIAIEPMTSAPDAFNNGLGLRRLAPGEEFSGAWGVRASD